jgi:uncharacterized protein DUF5681
MSTDEKVGYGKPPKAHQFKPGQSGNPRGRPKGAKNTDTIISDLLQKKLVLREGGGARKITIHEAIIRKFVENALNGNSKSATFILDRHESAQGRATETAELDQNDREVWDAVVRRLKESAKTEKE